MFVFNKIPIGDGRGGGGGDVINRGQYGRVAQWDEYPSPTRSRDKPSGRAYVGKVHGYDLLILIHAPIGTCVRCRAKHIFSDSFYQRTSKGLVCENCLCPSCYYPLDRDVSF